MNQAILEVTKNFINLFYPLHCAACSKALDPLNERMLCDFCLNRIRPNPKPYCLSCGRSTEKAQDLCTECRKTRFHFDRAYSACLYEDALKDLIHLFKYKARLSLGRVLSNLMIDFIKDSPEIIKDIDIVTFVPLERARMRERGFNQSKVLASNLAKEFGLMVSDTLEKAVSTRHQNELSRDERMSNLKGAFRAKRTPLPLKGLNVLVVDDVMTTGATLSECSKALVDAGVREVRCFTLARGL